jgi:hypothetical protein
MPYPILFGNMAGQGAELGTLGNPATSAVELLNAGKTTSGLYYINLPTVGPTQVYCDQTTMGGGWMLGMKIDTTLGTGTVRHYFDPSWWNEATGYSSAPSSPRTNGELKTAVYGYYPHSEMMLEYGYGGSYFSGIARARYTQPASGGAVNQRNTTFAQKMNVYHEGGGRTFNGYTTEQHRWTKQESTDNTFFPNAYAHLNFGSHANTGAAANDYFRIWFNANSDLSIDAASCNQIGGFGMSGDFTASSTTSYTESQSYTNGNASATVSPPAAVGGTTNTCQWNDMQAFAGSSGKNYVASNPRYEISTSYFNNGVGLIWVR